MEALYRLKLIFFLIALIAIGFIVALGLFMGKIGDRRRAKKMLSDEAIDEQINSQLDKNNLPLEKWQPQVIYQLTYEKKDSTSKDTSYHVGGNGFIVNNFGERYIQYAYFGNKLIDYQQIVATLNTTDFSIELAYEEFGFKLKVNGQYVGYYELKDEMGYFYNEKNHKIGYLTRRRGHISINEIDLIFKTVRLSYKNTHQHHIIEFLDGFQGELTNRRAEPRRITTFDLDRTPNSQQEKWLLALLFFEITHHQREYIVDSPYYGT